MDKKNNYAWGVPGITFIWHGQWADPEVEYKDYIFNYWDIEDAIADTAKEELGIPDNKDISDDQFDTWVNHNHDWIYGYMDDLVWIANGAP